MEIGHHIKPDRHRFMSISVARLNSSDQGRLDAWYEKAIEDETVSPHINLGIDRGSFKVMDDASYIMDEEGRGLAYFSRDCAGSRACDVSCWVLKGKEGESRRKIAIPLIMEGFKYLKHHSNVFFLEASAMETNVSAIRFLDEFLGASWGTEPLSAYDVSKEKWVGRVHYRNYIEKARANLEAMRKNEEG